MERNRPTRLIEVLFVVIALFFAGLIGCRENVPEPEPAASEEPVVECSPKAYRAGATDKERQEALGALLKQQTPECTKSYYELAESAEEQSKPAFKAAFGKAITCDRLKGLMGYLIEGIRGEIAQADLVYKRSSVTGDVSGADKLVLQRLSETATRKIRARAATLDWLIDGEEVKKAIRTHADCLAKTTRERFSSESLGERMYASLMASLLANAGERGFEAILATGVYTKDDTVFVGMMLESFGGHAVYPLLKLCEKASRKDVKSNLGTLVLMLPDTPSVYQRVIDAVNHGTFYPTKIQRAKSLVITTDEDKKKPRKPGEVRATIGEVIESALHGCWYLVDSKYEDNPVFAIYLSMHMPKKPRAQLISLFIKADAGVALRYYLGRDPNTFAKDTRTSLRLSLLDAPTVPVEDRQKLFEHLFKALPPAVQEREDMLFGIDDFPSAFQRTFIASNFRSLTPKEQGTAIYMIGKLPVSEKRKGFAAIRPFCNAKQKGTIEFYLLKGPSTDI